MDTLLLFAVAGASLAGAVAGAAACYWPMRRVITGLRERLARSEQARNGAVERSAQAREQIAQLNRAITELRLAHSTRANQASSRDQLEKALASGNDKTPASPHSNTGQPFADTHGMSKTG